MNCCERFFLQVFHCSQLAIVYTRKQLRQQSLALKKISVSSLNLISSSNLPSLVYPVGQVFHCKNRPHQTWAWKVAIIQWALSQNWQIWPRDRPLNNYYLFPYILMLRSSRRNMQAEWAFKAHQAHWGLKWRKTPRWAYPDKDNLESYLFNREM